MARCAARTGRPLAEVERKISSRSSVIADGELYRWPLLSLPRFGEFTVTQCQFFPGEPRVSLAQVTFTNTSQVTLETYSEESIFSDSGAARRH